MNPCRSALVIKLKARKKATVDIDAINMKSQIVKNSKEK